MGVRTVVFVAWQESVEGLVGNIRDLAVLGPSQAGRPGDRVGQLLLAGFLPTSRYSG